MADPEVRIGLDYSGADSFIMAANNGTAITVDGANDKLAIYDNDASEVRYINVDQLGVGGDFLPLTGGTISGTSLPALTVFGSGTTNPVFTVQGSSGELFSVTDSLTGSLFSVNDISGLPILEVYDNNEVLIGNNITRH